MISELVSLLWLHGSAPGDDQPHTPLWRQLHCLSGLVLFLCLDFALKCFMKCKEKKNQKALALLISAVCLVIHFILNASAFYISLISISIQFKTHPQEGQVGKFYR